MSETTTRDRADRRFDEGRQPIRHVAVCLDRSPVGDRSMPHAAAVARAFGAQLTVLHVLEPPHSGLRATLTDPLDWEVQRTEAARHLDTLRSEYGEAQPGSVGAAVLEGRPAEVIRDWIASHGVDLTVLATHGERGRTDWALASTARKLVEGVPGSLLMIPAESSKEMASRVDRFERVLVPLDGSARAESALAVANRLARFGGAEVLLLHVVPTPPHPCPCPLGDEERELDERLVERNVRAANVYLDGVAQRLDADGIRVRTEVTVDRSVPDEIQHRVLVDGVDLVVLSGHGHGGSAQQPVGAVAGYLLEQVTVPLLIVRDSSRSAPSTRPDTPRQTSVRLPHAADE